MPSQNAHSLSLERIPNVARPVVVPSKEDSAGYGKGDRCDAAENVVVRKRVQLAVGADIKEAARGVV